MHHPPARAHQPERRPGGEEHGIEIGRHRRAPARRASSVAERHVVRRPDAGVGHEAVEPAERRATLVGHRGPPRRGRPGRRRPRARAGRARGSPPPTASASAAARVIGDGHVGAGPREQQRRGAADAAAAAGDERGPARERDHRSPSRRSSRAEQRCLDQLDDEVLEREVERPGSGRCRRKAPPWPRPPARAARPPSRPRKATVAAPRVRAARAAASRFGLSPAGAVQHEQVARPAERLDLAREDLLEAEVVAGGREHRGVGGERDGGQRPAGRRRSGPRTRSRGAAHRPRCRRCRRRRACRRRGAPRRSASASARDLRRERLARRPPAPPGGRARPRRGRRSLRRRRAVGGAAASRCGGS